MLCCESIEDHIVQSTMAPSPDRAAGEKNIADAVPSSSHGKRGRGKATTTSESERVAKVARAPRIEETEAREEETAETPTAKVEEEGDIQDIPVANTTENIFKLLSNLSSDDRSVILDSLTDLSDLCRSTTDLHEANECEIRRLGGPMAIIQAVKKHVDAVLIQEEGIRALCNFTFPLPAMVLVGDIGGAEVILAGMKRHPAVANIQSRGCGAIANLLGTKRNAERLEESGGIAAVIAAMKVYPEDEEVQFHCCYALYNICEWAEYRPLVRAAGALVMISKVVEKYYVGNLRVREVAEDAIQELLKRD